MRLENILFILAVAIICVNAKIGRRKKCRQKYNNVGCTPPIIDMPCGYTSILEPTYGGFGTCNCQNMFLDELTTFSCGCQYDGYGILNSEVSNYGRVPAIKLPKMVSNLDACIPLPAINLPGLFDLVVDLPGCQCQNLQLNSCGCRNMPLPLVEYLSPVEIPSPFLTVPYAEPCYIQPKCQPMILPCGCQNMPCGCQNMPCSCQNMPCSCQNMPCGCQNMPCSCQNMPCSCQNMPCGCQNMPCGCQNMPCSCDNGLKVAYLPCGCQRGCGCQNGCGCQSMPYCQLPALPIDGPCGCQTCQLPLSPVELPVLGYGCQSMPPPATCCGGKYLRQVTLEPPFL